MSYRLQFIDSARFMSSSLSNLFNNITDMMTKNVKFVELNMNIKTVFLNTQNLQMIQQNTNVYDETKIMNNSLMKS